MRNLPLIAVGITVLAWSSAFIVMRAIAEEISPGAMTLGRLLVGSLVLGVVAATGRRIQVPRGMPLAIIVGYGVLWFGVYTYLVGAAEEHLDAGTTALLVNIAPIIVAVLGGFILHEGFPRALLVGVAIAFAGAAIIAFGSGGESDGNNRTLGIVLAVVAAVLYGCAVIGQKIALRTVDPFSATILGCFAGTVAALPFLPQLIDDVSRADAGAIAGIVWLGAVPTALAFLTWAYALKHTSAGVTASSTYLVPVITIALSAVFLGEAPGVLSYLGGAMCLIGVAVPRYAAARAVHRSLPVDTFESSVVGGGDTIAR